MRFKLIVLALIASISSGSYMYSSSAITCMFYSYYSGYKWCRNSITTSGYVCDYSDYSTVCGGSDQYRCSSQASTYLPQNSKFLLCPSDSNNCISQTASLYSSTDSRTLYSSYYSGGLCWYRFIPYSSDIANITIKINSVVNGAVEVYSEYAANSFTYKGLLSTGDSINVTVSNYSPVWAYIKTTYGYSYVSITGTAVAASSSSFDFTQIYIAVIVTSVCLGIIIICIIVGVILCRNYCRKHAVVPQYNPVASPPLPTYQNYVDPNQRMMQYQPQPQQVSGPTQIQQNIYMNGNAPTQPAPFIPNQPVPSMSVNHGAFQSCISPGIPVNQCN